MSTGHTASYSSRSTPQSMHTHEQSFHPSLQSSNSARAFVQDIHSRLDRADREERELARRLVPRLAARAYHLEDGNTWCQDWLQYQKNTHPVFGLCFHHKLHPIRGPQRIIILMGSIAFGLAITNIVFLGLLNSNSAGQWVNLVYNVTGEVSEIQYRYTHVQLEQSMLFLWTVGSFLHSAFDMLIWYLAACACFRPGGIAGRNSHFCQTLGLYIAVLVVVSMVFIATLVIVMRLNEDEQNWTQLMHIDDDSNKTMLSTGLNWTGLGFMNEDNNSTTSSLNSPRSTDETNSTGFPGISDLVYSKSDTKYAFLVGYAVELTIALFVYYFITSTVFFSGILGCGRIPIIGGRPYELRHIARNSSRREGRKTGSYDHSDSSHFSGNV
ncbi:hypothetical protein HJC23_006860 [Cyclotella cryptica]|uniref:Uncharacterized protein n=1 Tax=Cyclotella cryptica TaxID=29204 RepID=A0ABD3QCH9_9STRA|eukprot:CCRYP_006696-RA/>CCRYP_006696-RA protein AED:0.05 eAED:0.05 QI:319/1/1/1/0.5/0.33/3/141/382